MTQPRLWRAVLVGWAVAATILTLVAIPAIRHLWFYDPDDAMRLIEVRDWIAGQSWWDVSQHRLNHGDFAMHWSRLIDLPLAAVMLLGDPLLGSATSTRVAMTVVPLTTLLAAMALAAVLTRQLSDTERATLAIPLLPLSVPIVYQIRPMRIDHHGWQVMLALAAVTALLARPTVRSGALAGAALATLLTVSLEGLPITAMIVAVAVIAALFDAERRDQVLAMLGMLLGGLILLHLATRGPAILAPACDAIAPVWIVAIGIALVGACWPVAATTAPRWLRLVALGVAGAASLAALRTIAPVCTRGPFATLDPLVYRLWYINVSEGLPVWQQVPAWALMTISFPIVGLIGSVLAWRAAEGAARTRWLMMLALAGGSFGLSLLVMRTGATANALALPGGAWALHAMLTRARRVEAAGTRAIATLAALLAAAPGLLGSIMFGQPEMQPRASAAAAPAATQRVTRAECDRGHEIADLARLPAATVFAPIDVTPAMLASTAHRGIAGGYHRNVGALHTVLATFLADPATARRAVLASGATYVAGCPGANETELYKQVAPNGFWARLERGERFDWLQPVVIPGSPVLAWRVIGSSRKALSREASSP